MKYLLSLLLFYNLNLFCQIKSIKVEYGKAIKRIDVKTDKPPKIINNISYILLGNKSESLFFFDKRLNIDYTENNRLINKGGGNGLYYKSHKDSIRLHQTNFADQTFLINLKFNHYNWEITKESKKINNFLCFKAISKYVTYSALRKKELVFNLTAWFTPEIPFSYGPSGYDGLPGLVLEAQNGGVYFIAKKIIFDYEIKIKVPNKGRKVTQNEFDQIVTEHVRERFKIRQ